MKSLLIAIFMIGSLGANEFYGIPANQSANVDAKNILAQVKNIVILRSFDEAIWDKNVNSRKSHLEAYDIQTGNLLWCHNDVGIMVSFLVVDNEKLIYRNYSYLTAINVRDGTVAWSKKTRGEFSTIVGE